MKKLSKKFFLLFFLLFPLFSHADDCWWYGSIGAGRLEVYGLTISKTEQNLLGSPGVKGSSTVSNQSTYKEIMVGRCFNRYFAGELAYIDGISASTETDIRSVDVGVKVIQGFPIDFGNISGNLVARRTANVSATQLSLLGKLPLTNSVSLFGRIGVFHYTLDTTTEIHIPNQYNVYLASTASETGDVLMASGGVDMLLLFINNRLSVRGEFTKSGNVRIAAIGLIYRFKK